MVLVVGIKVPGTTVVIPDLCVLSVIFARAWRQDIEKSFIELPAKGKKSILCHDLDQNRSNILKF